MKQSPKKKTASKDRLLVTFELSPEAFEALQREAGLRGSSSHHQRAKEIVIDYLSNRELMEMRTMLGELDESLNDVKELIRRNTYAVMVHASDMENEVAKTWIREHMSHPLERR